MEVADERFMGPTLVAGAIGSVIEATVSDAGRPRLVQGSGTGPIDAFVDALQREFFNRIEVRDYHEHAAGSGADAVAVAYVELADGKSVRFGAGTDRSIVTASLRAVVSGYNRILKSEAKRAAVAV